MNSGITCAGIFAVILYSSLGSTAYGKMINLFPNPNFDNFDGNLPTGWTAKIWNQPMVKEKIHRSSPGRDGDGYCLEARANDADCSYLAVQPCIWRVGKPGLPL